MLDRYSSPLLSFAWASEPACRVGVFHAAAAATRAGVEAVAVPAKLAERYPERRVPLERPLEARAPREPRLFEAVVALERADAAAALAFARRWGLLLAAEEPLSRRAGGAPRWRGQRLAEWRSAAAELREAVELWRGLCAADAKGIGRVVSLRRRGGRAVARYRGPRGGFELSLPRRSSTDGARAVLAELVSRRLEADLAVVHERELRKGLRIVARPRSLLAAAWWQLAEHVTRDEARACPRCGRVFVVSLDVGGRKPVYCGGSCRVAAFRGRAKERA